MGAVWAAADGLRELEGAGADVLEQVLDELGGISGEGGLPEVALVLGVAAEHGHVASVLRLDLGALVVEEGRRLLLKAGKLLGEQGDLLPGSGELVFHELGSDREGRAING